MPLPKKRSNEEQLTFQLLKFAFIRVHLRKIQKSF
jgi:hypothetical protein